MSSAPVISVASLSKRYVIGHEVRHDTLRDRLTHGLGGLFRRRTAEQAAEEEFWALRDVTFDVRQGEVVGIIGRNGAGKSTLLKILSRITEPTTGSVALRGRVASLLEVGTGFHPELTGRENIFLNGAILGMSRAEIRKKFDEIVAFAEVTRFLDTPVKRYSSGMYVRLAFAVAAHLEPEILIVDEVLAVGDSAFQEKCIGKMQNVAREGRTVLFVSHNMAATQSLCTRVIMLGGGRIQFEGTAAQAVSRYLNAPSAENTGADAFHGADPAVRIDSLFFQPDDTRPAVELDCTLRAVQERRVAIELILVASNGTPVGFADMGSLDSKRQFRLLPGDNRSRWSIDVSRLANGRYFLHRQIVSPGAQNLLRHEHPVAFEICRQPRPPANRSLDLSWQVGAVELDLRRLDEA